MYFIFKLINTIIMKTCYSYFPHNYLIINFTYILLILNFDKEKYCNLKDSIESGVKLLGTKILFTRKIVWATFISKS